jgi:hypothetical protein
LLVGSVPCGPGLAEVLAARAGEAGLSHHVRDPGQAQAPPSPHLQVRTEYRHFDVFYKCIKRKLGDQIQSRLCWITVESAEEKEWKRGGCSDPTPPQRTNTI